VSRFVSQRLRRLAGGKDVVNLSGIHCKTAWMPWKPSFRVRERLCDENGEIRRFVNIYVNVRTSDLSLASRRPLKSGDEVSMSRCSRRISHGLITSSCCYKNTWFVDPFAEQFLLIFLVENVKNKAKNALQRGTFLLSC